MENGLVVEMDLSPVVASVVGLVDSEYEAVLLLFEHGLMVVSSCFKRHAALTRLFCLVNSRGCTAALCDLTQN